ncbi:MAG: C69 family dipeptidase [Chloroflexi bacterium]|nr:C69 family dipeptidase [Chloroflexota bacterium]
MNSFTPDNIGSCDTMVSVGSASARSNTVFGKNSDRPADETQPLELHPRQDHPADADAGCQFVSVPQAATTYRHVGSRPYWCHGYEHGFNEHQVIIGNEAFPTKALPAAEPRLIGMELVRLGLERGATAAEAIEVITSLTEQYGQGKFENDAGVRTYDNLFIVADPNEAYIVETVEHDWAVKRIEDVASISNVGSIRSNWSSISRPNAALNGGTPVDWGNEVADWDGSESGTNRQCRSSALLNDRSGTVDVKTMISVLSDHLLDESPATQPDPYPGDQRGICTHTAPGGAPSTTAASVVADLCSDGSRLPIYWCNLYSPCMGLYFPVLMEGQLPPALAIGGKIPSSDSPWWTFHELTQSGLAQGRNRVEEIRAAWAPLQADLFGLADGLAIEAAGLVASGQHAQASEQLTTFMAESVDRMMAIARNLSTTTAVTAR